MKIFNTETQKMMQNFDLIGKSSYMTTLKDIYALHKNKYIVSYKQQSPFGMQSLKIRITGHETQLNNKIVYIAQVKDQITGKTKVVKLRYSQFRDVHEEIQELITKLKLHITLPQFPGRKMFGSTNKSQQAIYERKKDLTNYLNDLLTIQKLSTLDVVKKYYIPDNIQVVDRSKNTQLNMQICIDRYTLVDDTVIYYVRLRDLNSHQEWTYKARYSQLRNVHQSLLESKIKNLPQFPKKKIFGITNESPDDIQKRREELQKYFNQIFDVKQVLNSQAIRYFIQQSKKQAQKQKYFETMRKKKKQI